MKLKHVGMIVVSVLAMSSAAVSAAEGDESVTTTVNGGVIHFKGEVVNAACAIDSESMNQTVELGQVRSSRLAKAGDLSSAVGFNIKLNDCDTNVSSNAAVATYVHLIFNEEWFLFGSTMKNYIISKRSINNSS